MAITINVNGVGASGGNKRQQPVQQPQSPPVSPQSGTTPVQPATQTQSPTPPQPPQPGSSPGNIPPASPTTQSGSVTPSGSGTPSGNGTPTTAPQSNPTFSVEAAPPTPPAAPPTPPSNPTAPPTPPSGGSGGSGSSGSGSGSSGSGPSGGGNGSTGGGSGSGSGSGNGNRGAFTYQRPDFQQFGPGQSSTQSTPTPTSDRMVEDIRKEMTSRGVFLVPGTSNFSTMMNTLRQQQRTSVLGQIDNEYNDRVSDIDLRKDALMYEINSRLQASKDNELNGETDPIRIKQINNRYDRFEEQEQRRADKFFAGEYSAAEQEHDQRTIEAEERLAEAMQRLTEEISSGNKDSYLNQLRDRYKEQIWRRDNAGTEVEAREASREAAKIQERMQRAMSGGGGVNWGSVATQAIGLASTLTNQYGNYVRLEDQERWGLPVQMSGAILNGNAYAAYRQEQAMERQKIDARWSMGGTAIGGIAGIAGGIAGGAAAGAAIGSILPGAGTVAGLIIGGLIAAAGAGIGNLVGGQAGYFFGGGRETEKEQKKADAADLWTQAESRIMQFNPLAMLMRPMANGLRIDAARETFINQANVETPGVVGGSFVKGDDHLDLYDLGYSAPEFAQQVVNRTKLRGFSEGFLDTEHALRQDALERYYNMSTNSIGQLSQYDRFGRNDATQDFANLAVTLDRLGTTGMSSRKGGYVRGDEFAGYMTQLQGSQRSTFLTVDNERAARQVATGQKVYGDKFGAEAMQGIQAVNNQVQNPGGGFQQTLLYDVIQELHPDARGKIDKIMEYQYSDKPGVQDEIQRAFAKRVQEIYGGVDTTSGFLAMQEIYGIQNPNILKPLMRQMTNGGGLEATKLSKADVNATTDVLNNENYTPQATQRLKNASDQQAALLIKYQDDMVDIAGKILEAVKKDIREKLDEVVLELRN